MRGLGIAGLVVLLFGLGAYYATGELGLFARTHLAAGGLALAVAAAASLRRLRGPSAAGGAGLLARRALALAALVALAVVLERGAQRLDLRFDWTVDRRFQPSAATLTALADLPPDVSATLYYDERDPRVRSTRLLLDVLADGGRLQVHERILDQALDDIERFGVTTSNSVVVATGNRFELVERPTEGALWEAFERLRAHGPRDAVYFSRGAGEADPRRTDDGGFSGAAVALATEGYAVRDLVLGSTDAMPDDAAVVVVAAPERALRPETVSMLGAWLASGGRLAVLLEPGSSSGLEPLLAAWGFGLPDGVVVDPASGPLEGGLPGVNPLAHAYADHPIAHGLDANRMTFFLGARPVEAERKPHPEDRLNAVVFSSPRAWLATDVEAVRRGVLATPAEAGAQRRWPLVAAGRYPRSAGEARIAVLGDSDFASNRYLRTLYNLDLWMNAIHWLAEREVRLTLRPKALTPDQAPLTPQESLAMLYGVGLLLPEIFLLAAVVSWVRRRSL